MRHVRTLTRVAVAACASGVLLAACAGVARPTGGPVVLEADTPESLGLVDARTRVPDIDLDIRYAGADNFVGAPVDGYGAPRCYLLPQAADALARVESALRRDGLRLRVYDCWRPVRAVRHFMRWAREVGDESTRAACYPRLRKAQLVPDYIAERSGHSRGAAIDLTLLDCRAGPCMPLDMGTPFDFFDTRAHTASPEVDAGARANRRRLVEAMARGGFANYPLEWWHFTLTPEPRPDRAYDAPIR